MYSLYISVLFVNLLFLCTYYDRTNKQLVIENVGVDFMQGESCLICEYTKTTD